MAWNIVKSLGGITKFIDLRILAISFLVGLVLVYFMVPSHRQVFVYPTPENVDQLRYRDKSGQCFEWKTHEVNCPQDPHEIYKIPGQV